MQPKVFERNGYYSKISTTTKIRPYCKECNKTILKGDGYLEAHLNFITFCSERCIDEWEKKNDS